MDKMKSNITIITPPEGWTEAWAKLGMDIINARVAGKQKQKDEGSIWRIPFHHYDADPKNVEKYFLKSSKVYLGSTTFGRAVKDPYIKTINFHNAVQSPK